jgi:lysozyme
MPKKINEAGIELIQRCEGLRLTAYKDVRGRWTIGFGHTGNVQPGSFITHELAAELLDHDLEEAEAAVERLVKVPLTDNEFSALVCFVFNEGEGRFATSTMLRKINQNDMVGASNEFTRWDMAKVNGVMVEVPGLRARRQAEQALFNS